jgi:hypothetical protein
LQYGVSFGRQQGAFVWQSHFTRPLLRGFQNLCKPGHDRIPKLSSEPKFYINAAVKQSAPLKCDNFRIAQNQCKFYSYAAGIDLWHNAFPGFELGIFRAQSGVLEYSVFNSINTLKLGRTQWR